MYRINSSTGTTYVVGALLVLFVLKFLFFSPAVPGAGAIHAASIAAQKSASKAVDLETSPAHNIRDNYDAFAEYRYRDVCKISSLELHKPFEPLCPDKQSLITAMSSGGRIGIDAPYMPRDCDMRWFTTEESCAILERFDRVSIVGDSMMRQMLGGLYVLLRKDLGYGGVTQWNFNDQEKAECFCNAQVNVKSCSLQTIYATRDILKWDPNSFACDPNKVNVFINLQVRYPQPDDELERYGSDLVGVPEGEKVAFIYGHGLWNDLDVQATLNYLDRAESVVKQKLPDYEKDVKRFPRLFITPNAAGPKKADAFILTQGNKPLMLFETSMYDVLPDRGYDVLGTWNMSIQSVSLDGVHCDIKGNLIKAMMLLNWLDKVSLE
ncbi:hypothetical protein BZA70DRAFT_287042 [Myxozyma melibiosi]|uniref:Uncharacterized protein n=1 Tax=Myxozyma melibiosi TaxID=54550 RepID=A0ABR1FFB9_9ASCO